MIKSTQLTTTGSTEVFRATSTGDNTGTPKTMAITNIMVCNTGTPSNTDETVNSCTLTLNLLVNSAPNNVATTANTIVKNLTIPAGETVFFSDEKIILDGNNKINATASVANLLSITVSSLEV